MKLITFLSIQFTVVGNKDNLKLLNLLKNKYQNLDAQGRNVLEDSKDTALSEFFRSNFIENNRTHGRKVTDYSDTLRMIYLQRYGGLYMDLDIISIKKIPDHLPKSFVAMNEVQTSYQVCFEFS